MNYFELYELPISFSPDPVTVKQKFYELSKKFHPDFYINSSEQKQNEVLELSTLNNKAFQVLKSPQQTLQYVLGLTGTLIEGENYTLPQFFLMEMMEVNEALMELEFEPDPAKLEDIKMIMSEKEKSLNDKLKVLTQTFDETNDNKEQILNSIKDLFYRNKYLLRIKDRLTAQQH